MPAVMNEAFTSPFHENVRQPNMDERSLSSGTTNIRNYHVPQQGISFGVTDPVHIQPYDNTSCFMPIQAQPQPQPQAQVPQWGGQESVAKPPQPEQLSYKHNCDRLIIDLMSCPKCREKLRKILKGMEDDQNPSQSGGFSSINIGDDRLNVIITTVAILFLVLFMIDRLVHYRLAFRA